MRRRTVLGLAASALATGALPRLVRADTWPSRPVRFLAPSAAGGSLDILARLFARGLGEKFGQSFYVENRGGGGGNIGYDLVAKSPPDGYTMMVASDPLAVNVSIYENLTYDPLKDFTPVVMIAYLSQVLAVNPKVPARTFAEFVALARAKPHTLNVGSSGNGAPGHLACALLAQAGIEVVHVPYRGAGPAVLDAVAGQIDATICTLPGTLGMIKGGQLRALAVSTSKRSRFLPDVPTMAEVVPTAIVDSWHGFFVPAGTPREIVDRLNGACRALLQTKEVLTALDAQGFEAAGGPPEELGKFLREEITRWAPIIKAAGIHA